MTTERPAGEFQRLAENAERAATEARAKIRRAIAAIERDIENNDGIYPSNKGRVTASEVVRRAGLSPAILQGAAHKESTRVEVNAFVGRARKYIGIGHKSIRRAVTERADDAKGRFEALQNGWVIAELEYVEQSSQIARMTAAMKAADRRIADLERENKELRSRLATPRISASGEVIPLRAGSEVPDA